MTWTTTVLRCLIITALLSIASTVGAATVTASWNANTESNIAGYKLSSGIQSGVYSSTIDVGNVTSNVVPVLAGQTYYFVVQAYDTSGMLSGYSTEVAVAVPTSTPPAIVSLTPAGGPVGTWVTIAGSNFGATQGASTVTFNGTTATPTSWAATSVVVPVPAGATTGNVVVTVGGLASNGSAFTVTVPPAITTLAPTSGPVGTAVTITGTNFGASQGTSSVKFNGTTATPTSWTATSVVVPVPAGATTGNVVVTVGGLASNGTAFTVMVPPAITSLAPTSGPVGTAVTIAGTNFGATQGASTVKFNGTTATPTNWAATSVVVPVPAGATTGNVVVTVGGLASNGSVFTVTVPPAITNMAPTSGPVGTSVTITGTNFGTTQGASTVKFNGTTATPTSWTATSVVVPVPAGATTGNVVVTVGGLASNGTAFTVMVPPAITSLAPTSGPVGTAVTITGTNFGATQGASTVTFNGTPATPTSWAATSVVMPVPAGATTGNVVVTVGGLASNGSAFTVTVPPAITTLAPTSGPVGTAVAITGTNFGATQGASTVKFNGTTATPTSWSATSLVVTVPAGAASGNVVVNVGGVATNGVAFTVLSAGGISLVQHASKDTGGTSVALSFASDNTAGNFIAVVARVFMPDQAITVSDSRGNVYTQAVQLNNQSDDTLAIFYAENIAGGANTVTVSISGELSVRLAIFEYAGVASVNSLEAVSSQSATGSTLSSGNATTRSAGDLLVGAFSSQGYRTFTPGGGYTTREEVSAAPSTALLVADAIQASAGTVSASATLSSSNNWAAALAAFKPVTGITSPVITNMAPTSGPVGTAVTITGTNFGATQGASTVTFNGTPATPTSWAVTSVVVPVPAGATTGNVVVTVGGLASNALTFTVNPAVNNPPVLGVIANQTSAENSAVALQLVGSDPDGTALQYSATNLPGGLTINSATGLITGTPTYTSAGTYSVTATVSDGVLSASRAFTWTVTNVDRPPVLTNPGTRSSASGATVSLQLAATDPDGDVLTYSAAGLPAGLTVNSATGLITGTVPGPAGTYAVTATVSDGTLSNSQSFTWTVTVGSQAIALVQHTRFDAGVTTRATLAFVNANTSGNFIAVVVRAGAAGVVFTVTDSRGNLYRQAARFNNNANNTVGVYYAQNIASGANTVTVAQAASKNLRISVLEYAGVALADSLDGVITAFGTGASPNSGTLTTTASGDLLLGVVSTSNRANVTAGPGFVLEEAVPALPNARLVAEDGVQPIAGAAAAAVTLSAAVQWGAALVAFKAATPGVAALTVPGVAALTTPGVAGATTARAAAQRTDYDGDGKADLATFTPSTGTWTILESGANYTRSMSVAWGASTDRQVPGDYDGDGKADVAVYRPSTGIWYILASSTNYTAGVSYSLGVPGDAPVPADYDGDGRTDYAVYRPSTGEWLIVPSSTNARTTTVWGSGGDIPAPGDYDGDHKADLALFSPATGTWSILKSTTGYATNLTATLGAVGDIPVPADYDGDGTTDIAVYRPASGTWSVLQSQLQFMTGATRSLGGPTDIPVPADYDGDGKTDIAVYHVATRSWQIVKSSDGSTMTATWGSIGDVPLPSLP